VPRHKKNQTKIKWMRILALLLAALVVVCRPVDRKSDRINTFAVTEEGILNVIGEEIRRSDEPFYIMDMRFVDQQYKQWKEMLPRVTPFYAIKCNPDEKILLRLSALGAGFDCASLKEMQQVLDLGISPERIVFANACKARSHIKYAKDNGVSKMTFDNEEELKKISQIYPEAELILRILPEYSEARCQLGVKFGADVSTAKHLLERAKELGLNVMGISFHVGSGCDTPLPYKLAVDLARQTLEMAKDLGFRISLLDIGGGFPGSKESESTFRTISDTLRKEIDELFPSDIAIIAEPGRYFVAGASTLYTQITSKRKVITNGTVGYQYYINDGVYGSFNCLVFDYAVVFPLPLLTRGDEKTFPSVFWGPSCDGLDKVKEIEMPELFVDEWVVFEDMGAYTICAASTFNGFDRPRVIYYE
jgi:ornithine decarboxylase